ncbi:MAG TPA: hypothetical protein PKD18_01530 [Saprospiraceae bacterium]|nr:hypothetical protein [Saprospiraceae bacterium]
MTEYLLLFRNASAENGYLATSQDMAEDMPKWQSWIGNIAMQGKLVSTAPMRYDASIVTNDGIDVGQPYKESNSVLVSGFLLCKAENIEEVQEWSKTCPILKYPNSSVEIRPLVPFPTNLAREQELETVNFMRNLMVTGALLGFAKYVAKDKRVIG